MEFEKVDENISERNCVTRWHLVKKWFKIRQRIFLQK